MLKHTFLHIPGVGPKTELRLWQRGIISWEKFLTNSALSGLGRRSRTDLDSYIERSIEALAHGDALFFEDLLPGRETWRIYAEFRGGSVFLDIETTGLGDGDDYITVIGLFDGREMKTFIEGQNLQDFPGELKKYSIIVTYGGKCFDIPFIASEFKGFRFTQAHIDLRYLLYKVGYSGGLKQIEANLGIQREKGLRDMDGYLATILWQRHLEGDERALPALVRYNMEDAVNLKYLMEFGYNRMIDSLPIPVDHLELSKKTKVDLTFDSRIIEEMRGEMG